MSPKQTRLSIGGMSCAGCVKAVEDALRAVPGVAQASVNLGERTAMVEGEVPSEALILAVKEAGYEAAELGGVRVVVAEVPGGPNELRQMIDRLRRKAAPVAVLLANRREEDQKVTLFAGLSRDLVGRGLDAVKWVRAAAAVVDGGGGGRPDMAQAGGKLPEKLPEALEAARGEIEKLLAGA